MRVCFLSLWLLVSSLSWLGAQPDDRRYVMAPNGLNLREGPSAQAARLLTLPMGAAVELLAPGTGSPLVVDGLSGGMAQVRWEGQTGFVFEGYLCPFPPPAGEPRDVGAYVEQLRALGYDVYQESINRDWGGYYQAEEAFVLPAQDWATAFLVAQRLFPELDAFAFPGLSGPAEQEISHPREDDLAWENVLRVTRRGQAGLLSLVYTYRAEGFGTVIRINPDPDIQGLRISRLSIAD